MPMVGFADENDERLSFAFAPAAFVAFVLAPSIVLARRAARAFSADDLRLSNQAKFTDDVLDSVPVALAMRDQEASTCS